MCVSHLLDFVKNTGLQPSQGSPAEAQLLQLIPSGPDVV